MSIQTTLTQEQVERANLHMSIRSIDNILNHDDYLSYLHTMKYELEECLDRVKKLEKLESRKKLEQQTPIPNNLSIKEFSLE